MQKQRYVQILNWFLKNAPVAETDCITLSLPAAGRRHPVRPVYGSQGEYGRPELFKRFSPADLAAATFDEVFPYVKSITYPNSKTKYLIGMAQKLMADFDGEVPSDTKALMSLPGVGRKTANVIASVLYDKPVIAVDTHVFRVSRRLGLSDGRTVKAVEKELERNIPVEIRAKAHHWLILHGRYTCTARAPRCGECGLRNWCRDYAQRNPTTENLT